MNFSAGFCHLCAISGALAEGPRWQVGGLLRGPGDAVGDVLYSVHSLNDFGLGAAQLYILYNRN